MARLLRLTMCLALGLAVIAGPATADNGNAPTTLSFFSGGGGAHADWFVTADQPEGDLDRQAIRLLTTADPTLEHGYAGVLFHHVEGIPASAFPDSAFWNKVPFNPGATLGSPRLVVAFQDAAGDFVGYGALRENARSNQWEPVNDVGAYPNSAWDVMGGPCIFQYNVKWQNVQTCFAGTTVLSVFIVADSYGIYHMLDDIEVNGKTFSSASDNGNGSNSSAGPEATTDPSLLPPLAALVLSN